MAGIALIFLLSIMIAAFVFLPVFNIVRKIRSAGLAKKISGYRNGIMLKIENILSVSETELKDVLDDFTKDARNREKGYIDTLDDYLLYVLEILEINENRDRLVAIARMLDFSLDCVNQIKNKDPGISARGARRAGLYMVIDAAGEMMAALNIISSENQFEILTGLARFGRADLMQKAFEKISKNVLLNDRAVTEILSVFPMGDEKITLFRNMIRTDSDYISALFLKAISKDMPLALSLSDDIKTVLRERSKEVRAAAVRGLSALGASLPQNEIIAALEDHDWEVRAIAAKALRNAKQPESSLALYKALYDQQWWVRQNAANALMTHADFEPLFILAAESGDEYTRDSIIAALENGGNPVLLRSIKRMAA